MNVIVHESPGKNSRSCRFPYLANPRKKMLTVLVIPENISSLYAANHHMMKRSGCIQSRLSWHGCIISQSELVVNVFVTVVNYVPFVTVPFVTNYNHGHFAKVPDR
jgi:hypothetical protein